mgnify:CR=1 FL=1
MGSFLEQASQQLSQQANLLYHLWPCVDDHLCTHSIYPRVLSIDQQRLCE